MHRSKRYVKLGENELTELPPLLGQALAGADFVLAEWVDEGETSAAWPIAPLHVHHGDDEAWYVLEGALGFRRGDDELVAPAGSAVLVPAGVPHTFWNAAGARTRYVIVMTPRIAALIEALHSPVDDVHALFARHDSALVE